MTQAIQWLWYAVLRVPVALAQASSPITGPTVDFPNPLGSCNTTPATLCVLNRIIDVIFTFAIPVTAIMVLVAGYQMVTAAGNPEKFTTGRKTLQYTAIGFGLVVLAKSVAPVLISILTS